MSEFGNQGSTFSDNEEVENLNYKPFSQAAIYALALGVLSACALISPILWTIPLLGVVTSLIALRSTSPSGRALAGRWLAMVGLSLALLFGAWAPARLLSREIVLRKQAREYGDVWLGLVSKGDLYRAHQLHFQRSARLPDDADLAAFYNVGSKERENLNKYFGEKVLANIIAAGPDAKLVLEQDKVIDSFAIKGADLIQLRYNLNWTDKATKQENKQTFTMLMARFYDEKAKDVYWYVAKIEAVKR